MAASGKKNHLYMYLNAGEHPYLIAVAAATTVAAGLILPVMAILTGRLFDLLATADQYDAEKLRKELIIRSMSIIALAGTSLAVTWASLSSWMAIGECQGFAIRKRLLESYLTRPMEWYDLNGDNCGRFTQLNRCVEEVRAGSAETSAIASRSIVTLFALVGTSFYYSWSLTLVTMCSSPIMILVAIVFSRLIEKNAILENKHTSEASRIMNWSMSAVRLVKLSGAQLKEILKFKKCVLKSRNSFLNICMYTAANTAILRFLALAMFVQAFWFGSTMIRKGHLDVAEVITCFHSCVLLGSTINGILHQTLSLQKGKVAIQQVSEFLEWCNSKPKSECTQSAPEDIIHGDITFERVSFAYPSRSNEDVLRNVTLKLAAGETTFIVGKSGSGKSTLSNLLLGLYGCHQGEIYIDGERIRNLEPNLLMENITLVEQRCNLFNDTLRQNILLGSCSPDDVKNSARLKTACRISLLEKLINDLPDGLETWIGSGGITLSGGQQQRVAIARAFMRDSPILILDEALSALDSIHRCLLLKAIRRWRSGRTTVILTHDYAQIEPEDFVYVLKDGKCIEKGYSRMLLSDHSTSFYEWKHINDFNDESDNVSQLTRVEDYSRKELIVDSLTCLDTETPKMDRIGEFFPDLDERKLSKSRGDRRRLNNSRITSEEIVPRKNFDKGISKKDPKKLMPILSIITKMFRHCHNKTFLVTGIILAMFAGAANPVFSYTVSFLLNGILPREDGVGSISYLIKWSLITIAVAGSDATFGFLKDLIIGYYSENWIMALRNEAMNKITYKEFEWFLRAENNESEISALILNDLRDLRSLATEFLTSFSTFIVVSSFGLIWAMVSGWKLSLVCISMFPLIIIFSTAYGIFLQKYETNYKTRVADLENLHYEIFTKIKTIRCLQIELHFWMQCRNLESNMRSVAGIRVIGTGLGVAAVEALTLCIQGILFYYALKLVIEGEYSSQRMFQTFTLLLFTIMTCSNLVSQIPDVSRGQRAATWLYRLLDEEDRNEIPCQAYSRNASVTWIKNAQSPLISIKNLSFSYPSAPKLKIFRHMNLNLHSGKTYAVVGESGSGKSTLVSLLTLLHRPQPNTIYIDGTDLNEWSLNNLRSQIAVVEQKPTLFYGTIRENLTYGALREIMEIEIYDMLKYVGIHDFIYNSSDGLETMVRSELLSGGEAQRLCIARALLRKPAILILDECTSALDPVSSHIITKLVQKGCGALLTVSITHSREMMQVCEEVAVLRNGQVVEQGPLEDLIERRGVLYSFIATSSQHNY